MNTKAVGSGSTSGMRRSCDAPDVGCSYFVVRKSETEEDFWRRLEVDNAGGEPIPNEETFSTRNSTMVEIGRVMLAQLASDDRLIREFHYASPDRVRAEVSARIGQRLRELMESTREGGRSDSGTTPPVDPELREIIWEFALVCERGGQANGLIVS